MDKKKSNASGEKKDENFLTKTAHSIRDKVHGFTDDVKEKTHNLTHSSESKKNKKGKDLKKGDTKSKTSSKNAAAGKEGSSASSGDEHASPQPASSRGAASVPKRDNERDVNKSANALPSKSSSGTTAAAAASASTTEKKDATSSNNSRFPPDKPTSRDRASKPSDDQKSTASSSSKPTSDNSTAKPSSTSTTNESRSSINKSNKAVEGGSATNKSSSEKNNSDHVHLSFDGVVTVGDLLDRIDETVERANIIVENGQGTKGLNIERTKPGITPTVADLERRSVKKDEDGENKLEEKKNEDEPIRLNYNEIHTIEDILRKVNKQKANRKVVLENAPNDSASITVKTQSNPSSTTQSTSRTANENDDSSGPPKSILKTSQDPSSLDTSTKVSSFQDDQIHVNIEGIQSVNDFLDRIDNAVQTVPVIIDSKSQGDKRPAPQAPNQHDNNKLLASNASVANPKREAPKPPTLSNDAPPTNRKSEGDNVASPTDKKLEGRKEPPPTKKKPGRDIQTSLTIKNKENDETPTFKIPEHEFESNSNNRRHSSSSSSSSSTTTEEKNKDGDDKTAWV